MKPSKAEGWYRDPYELHEDRWFSAGRATSLVRDAGQEASDEPPDQPYDPADLVRVSETDDFDATDMRRADEASGGTYNGEAAKRAAFDAFIQMTPPS